MEAVVLIAVVVITLVLASLLWDRGGPGRGDIIAGKPYVTDGDGIRVNGHDIRLAGLDAPEWDQWAQHQDGSWFEHGKQVKSELIRAIGGEHVSVRVHTHDRYGRVIGTVTCHGHDVGEWLVEHGHAIAAYGNRYKRVEAEARRAGRGLWGHATSYDPRSWRHHRKPGG